VVYDAQAQLRTVPTAEEPAKDEDRDERQPQAGDEQGPVAQEHPELSVESREKGLHICAIAFSMRSTN
jgi:hypothetical protein